MQLIPIDLKKNTEVADLLTDMQPGQRVYICATIKDKDSDKANFRIEEVVSDPSQLPDPDEKYDDEDEDDGSISKPKEEGDAEASGAGREQTNGSGAAPVDSMGQSGPFGG